MKNIKLTLEKFKKSNLQRRISLAIRFGYKDVDTLKVALENGTFEIQKSKKVDYNSYEEFCNLSRKVQTAESTKKGYSTLSGYKSYLRGKFSIKNTPVANTTTNGILNIYILDESSSMRWDDKDKAMLEGVKNEVTTLIKENVQNIKMSIVGFSSNFNFNGVTQLKLSNLADVQLIKYIRGGGTPLHDAVGITLTSLKKYLEIYPNNKTIVKIFTDGDENTSCKFNAVEVALLISEVESMGVTVTFMGTSNDVYKVTKLYKLKEGNTLVHNNTQESILRSFNVSTISTVSYSKSVVTGKDVSQNFFTKEIIK